MSEGADQIVSGVSAPTLASFTLPEKWEGELKGQITDLKRSLARSEEDSSMARKTAE